VRSIETVDLHLVSSSLSFEKTRQIVSSSERIVKGEDYIFFLKSPCRARKGKSEIQQGHDEKDFKLIISHPGREGQ
jgi:hypothetical protein